MGGADQLPLAFDAPQTTKPEATKTTGFFNVSEHRFDGRFAQRKMRDRREVNPMPVALLLLGTLCPWLLSKILQCEENAFSKLAGWPNLFLFRSYFLTPTIWVINSRAEFARGWAERMSNYVRVRSWSVWHSLSRKTNGLPAFSSCNRAVQAGLAMCLLKTSTSPRLTTHCFAENEDRT